MIEAVMASWHLPLNQILDDLTLPQLRLLFRQLQVRETREKRWDLYRLSFLVSSEAQAEALQEALGELEETEEAPNGGHVWSPPKKYPLLHEISPRQAELMGLPIKYVKVSEDVSG